VLRWNITFTELTSHIKTWKTEKINKPKKTKNLKHVYKNLGFFPALGAIGYISITHSHSFTHWLKYLSYLLTYIHISAVADGSTALTCRLQVKVWAVSDQRQSRGDRKRQIREQRQQMDGPEVGVDAHSKSLVQTLSGVDQVERRRNASAAGVYVDTRNKRHLVGWFIYRHWPLHWTRLIIQPGPST